MRIGFVFDVLMKELCAFVLQDRSLVFKKPIALLEKKRGTNKYLLYTISVQL